MYVYYECAAPILAMEKLAACPPVVSTDVATSLLWIYWCWNGCRNKVAAPSDLMCQRVHDASMLDNRQLPVGRRPEAAPCSHETNLAHTLKRPHDGVVLHARTSLSHWSITVILKMPPPALLECNLECSAMKAGQGQIHGGRYSGRRKNRIRRSGTVP